ncbi:phosphatase PAP2 family protein [Shewanella sp. KX20019]|uniref:phosphatase PAP2 family protein n=1 Tax=Shewanella sp. KX20019 TaxID=2803864 RepID=UPI001926E1E4|nr:phosphatase PAP2 family protein [Shewanella sp. KX20019]QQX79741.1 phosphatase PAP2 family protein [Shewanella sp. KX20019]
MITSISKLDQNGYRFVVKQGQEHGLQPLALSISASGNGPVYLYVAVLFILLDSHGESLINMLLAAYLVELPLYFLLKNIIRRQRPCHALADGIARFEPADKFSLPSGHTAAAFVMATSIYFTYPALFYIASCWAISVGLSRVILGVHYPLDIIAGALLGVASVVLSQHII